MNFQKYFIPLSLTNFSTKCSDVIAAFTRWIECLIVNNSLLMDERLPFCFELLDETKIPPIACSSHASIEDSSQVHGLNLDCCFLQ
jgi:hypothetical protein